MRSIQMDDAVPRADLIVPGLLEASPQPQTDDGRLLLSRIGEWDRRCGVSSLGCAAYMTVELAVQRAVFDDELGPLARDYVATPPAWQALIDVLGNEASPWWDIVSESGTANGDVATIVAQSIDASAAQLRAALGDPARWTWGSLHQVTFRESTLGSSGLLPLELYFNAQPRAVAGAEGAVNNTFVQAWRAYADPYDAGYEPIGIAELFAVAGGPSYRFTIDMSDLDGARIVITTGQSGNAFDPHSIDMIPLWAEGESVPLPFSAANILASGAETLTLTPR
jgi:penicillin amidase